MQRTARQHASDKAHEFLASRIDYERTSAVAYNDRDFRLDRMRDLLVRLGNPHQQLKIIHAAGTKGKGSTAAMIAAILHAAGIRTGLYSSPHLDRVEERLAIDGASCPAAEFDDLVARIHPVVAAMDADTTPGDDGTNRPTYFEIVTAMAFLHFARQKVDAAVLEVGLGGRLDSTNVCDPLVSVITSISFDHTRQLGNTLAAIAGEKAGIIKPGRPVVSGVIEAEPREVVARVARENGCPLVELGRDFDFIYRPPANVETAPCRSSVDFIDRTGHTERILSGLEVNLIGRHQAANAAVALATIGQMNLAGWSIPERAIRAGLSAVRWPARIEVVHRHPTIILDSAHNVASVDALVRVLDESFSARRRLLVFATSKDKDVAGMLDLLLPRFDEVIFTRYLNNPRSVPVDELAAIGAQRSGTSFQVCPDPETAWQAASRLASPSDLICITGSFFIAAEVRQAMIMSPPAVSLPIPSIVY